MNNINSIVYFTSEFQGDSKKETQKNENFKGIKKKKNSLKPKQIVSKTKDVFNIY